MTRKLILTGLTALMVTIMLSWSWLSAQNSPETDRESRSPKWPKVRKEFLKTHPACESCGQKDNLQVHHVVAFHCDPKLELDPENLITLCTDGPSNLNCHFVIGHCGNTKTNNPHVRRDAQRMRALLAGGIDCAPKTQ